MGGIGSVWFVGPDAAAVFVRPDIVNGCEKIGSFVYNNPVVLGTAVGSVWFFGPDIAAGLTFVTVSTGSYINSFFNHKQRHLYMDLPLVIRIPRESDARIIEVEQRYYFSLRVFYNFKEKYCEGSLRPDQINSFDLERTN